MTMRRRKHHNTAAHQEQRVLRRYGIRLGARIERKLQEQYLAVQLEKNSGMSKEDTKKLIITNYLNTINLGNNTLGVKVADQTLFQ